MSNTLIFEHYPLDASVLPAGWIVVTIGQISTGIESGFASGEHNESGKGFPHLRPMNIDRQGRLDFSKVKFVDIESPRRVHFGDVLFNNTNSPELVGKTTVISSEAELAFSNHMTRISLPGGIDPRFVASQLHFLWMTGYFKHRCVNHVNQASISRDPLSDTVPVLLPPSVEQQRISDTLDELLSDLDAGAEALTRAQRKLDQYRSSILKAAVLGDRTSDWRRKHPDAEPASSLLQRMLHDRRKRWEQEQLDDFKASGKTPPANWKGRYKEPIPPETASLPALPEGWCWASAEQLCDFITKGTTPPGVDAPASQGEIPFIKVQHLSGDNSFLFDQSPSYISTETNNRFLARSKVFPGDVLMNIVGPPLGQVSIVPDDFPMWNVNQAIAIFRSVTGVDNRYLALCLSTHSILVRALKRAKATAGQINLTLEICRSLPIPLPPVDEQAAIVEFADEQLSTIKHLAGDLTIKSETTKALRQSMLMHAFTGKLITQDPDDEPASELLKRIATAREAQPTKSKKKTAMRRVSNRRKRKLS